MASGVRDDLSIWENYRFVVDEFRQLDAERVLVDSSGRGKRSRLDLNAERQ
jgi:hypothetical protein